MEDARRLQWWSIFRTDGGSMQPRCMLSVARKASSVLMAFLLSSVMASPQQPPASKAPQANTPAEVLRDLEGEIRELSSSLHEMHAEMKRSRLEAEQLRQELQETREQV